MTMHKRKPELIKMLREWDEDQPEYGATQLLEDVQETERFFFGLREMVHLAELRLLIAGAAHECGRTA